MLEIKKGTEAVFWDFDGVLMDSNPVRNTGFSAVLSNYPEGEVAQLLAYHRANGGLSRYVKFRYFFEQVRHETVTEQKIKELATAFSTIMRDRLLDGSLLIAETVNWVKEHYQQLPMHIVSGSDQAELRFLCAHHQLAPYFKDIMGSPVPKKQLVAGLLQHYGYQAGNCVLVGDAINDYDAAQVNGLQFFAYNNPSLASHTTY